MRVEVPLADGVKVSVQLPELKVQLGVPKVPVPPLRATVPVAVLAVWAYFYLTNLMQRPLINVNDPHVAEMLEVDHAD